MAGVKVSHPDDAHEKEAEAVAKHVTSGGDPAHEHGATAKTAPSAGAPGDPPKVVGDPEMAHRAVAPHTATPTAAAQHPATQVASTPHPAPAQPHTAAPQHTAPQTPAAQHQATPQHTASQTPAAQHPATPVASTPHPATPQHAAPQTSATQHPATHGATTQHPGPAQPHTAAPQHTAPQSPTAQHPAPHGATTQHPGHAGRNSASILDHPGPGQPIPQPTRGILEARLKADLSHVVVHHDAAADQAVRALHARAVTRGNHIFLASDASPNDLSLMAHEVTHVLHHQGGVVHRQAANAPAAPANAPAAPYYKGKEGTIDSATKKAVEIPDVPYANAKLKLSGVDVRAKFKAGTRTVRPNPRSSSAKKQRDKWWKNINRSETEKIISDLIKPDTAQLPVADRKPATDPSAMHLLRFGVAGSTAARQNAETDGVKIARPLDGVIVGTKDQLIDTALLPHWDRNRKYNPMNVDHLVELQVGGLDEFDNYWLWEAKANQSAGGQLFIAINEQVTRLFTAARKKHKNDPGGLPFPRASPSTTGRSGRSRSAIWGQSQRNKRQRQRLLDRCGGQQRRARQAAQQGHHRRRRGNGPGRQGEQGRPDHHRRRRVRRRSTGAVALEKGPEERFRQGREQRLQGAPPSL
ncbi:eCIS core domain-containing protein [Kitasatospora acidiphila]|nr:DUF4157 domain-containing protein [Kitasatospora acidiphila]